MSKKIDESELSTQAVPFFAHLLSSESDPAKPTTGGTAPTYHCFDSICTKKYPSDDDEPTSSLWDK